MRILQICNKAPYPPNDGSSIAIYNMASGLVSNLAEVHLLTINTKKHFKDDALVPEKFKAETHYQSVFKNTDTTVSGALFNLFSGDSYFVSRFYFPEFEIELIKKLKAHPFDIVQLEGLFMGKYIPAIRKYSHAKIVLRAHNVEFLIWERHLKHETNLLKKWYINLQNKRLKRLELDGLTKTNAVVTITEADKEYSHKIYPKLNAVNCPTGVNLSEYNQGIHSKKENKTIFYFGSMDWMPNQEAVEWFLKNCWSKIQQLHPECRFIIAGRHMPERFRQLNTKLVKVIENVTDKTAFYSTYDIMLVPLLSGSGLRIKIIEGLSYGKAIISTSVGAEGIPAIPGRDLLIADGTDDFVEAVDLLLKDADKKSELEKNAKNFAAEQLDNKMITSKLVEFYKTLIHS